MAEPLPRNPEGSPEHAGEPLIALVLEENGREVTRYFTDDAAADAALPAESIQDALALAGAWSGLDWDEMIDALDQIRHQTPPSPPLTL
jgi:hypothetical protein